MNQRDCKITNDEFLSLGFHLEDDTFMGTCWKSEQQIIHQGAWSGTEEPDHCRFMYVLRQNRCIDRLNYNRQGHVEDIYDLADFVMELKEFPREGKQLNHNKGLYEQMQNGNIRPYTTSLTLDDIRRAFEAEDRERQSRRRIQMQTGVEGMRVFNQALLDEFSQLHNPWAMTPLEEQPLMRMTDFRGDELNHYMDVEEGRFTYSVPYPRTVENIPVPGVDGQPFTVRLDRNDFAQATNYGILQSMNVWRTDIDGLEIIG